MTIVLRLKFQIQSKEEKVQVHFRNIDIRYTGETLNVELMTKKIFTKFSDMKLPDENCEREYEVVQGENDESLFPLPGSIAQLPVDH